MRTFAQFLKEAASAGVPKISYPVGSHLSGNFALPNLSRPEPVKPKWGYENFVDAQRAQIEKDNLEKNKELWGWKAMLENFAALAEQGYSAWSLKTQGPQENPGQKHNTKAYYTVQYDQNSETLYDFTENEILSGNYPRLRVEDLRYGVERGIFDEYIKDDGKKYYSLKIGKLREEMITMKRDLQKFQKEQQKLLDKAQAKDNLYSGAKNFLGNAIQSATQSKGYIRDTTKATY